MADYKKIIEIAADIRPAQKAFQDLSSVFSLTAKEIDKKFSASMAETITELKPLVNTLFSSIEEKKIAEQLGDTSKVADAARAIAEAESKLKETAEGAKFLENMEAAKKAAQEMQLINYAGLTAQQRQIDQLRDAMSRGALRLTTDETTELDNALNERQKILDEIAKKQLELNRLEMLSNESTEEKDALIREIAALKASISPDVAGSAASGATSGSSLSGKAAYAKDVKTALSNLNPFNEKRMEKFKENGKYETVGGAALGKLTDRFYKAISNAIKSLGKFFVKTFKESFDQLNKMAQYDAGTSLYSNASARERQLTFGLSGAQNYAMSKAMELLNMNSIEDLMWANSKQTEQYNRITEILEKQYAKLEASGIMDTAQQFQLDIALMKMQFQNTVYQFISAHKGALEKIIDMAFKFMEGVLEFLGFIADGLSVLYGGNQYATKDILSTAINSPSSTVNTDNTRNINATINYTNNQSNDSSGSALSESAMNQLIAVLNG